MSTVAKSVLEVTGVYWKNGTGDYIRWSPRFSLGEDQLWSTNQTMVQPCWTIFGTTLYLLPKPQTTQVIKITFVEDVPDISDSDTVVSPFGGRFPSYHDVVGWLACHMASTKDEKPGRYHDVYMARKKQLIEHMGRWQGAESRTIIAR